MDSKRVFILGAGSSIGHSNGLFPSVTGFFSATRKLCNIGICNQSQFNLIANYAQEITGREILISRDRTDIEALFTHIEIELERKPSFELMAVRQQLLKLIQIVLIGLEESLERQSGEYIDFISQLNAKDTIITFNWDLLLDNILDRNEILAHQYKGKSLDVSGDHHYLNFISDFSAFGEGTWDRISVDKPYQHWKPESGSFLKMHGSVDWFYCANKSCRAANKAFPLLEPTMIHYCSECHENLEPLLIPPILNKAYRQYPVIRKIWNLASKEMSSVEELIIWGYSLPPTDFYSVWLLKQARRSIRKLTIIDPNVVDKKKKTLKVSFIRKFVNVFHGILNPATILLYESFSDYYLKYNIKDKYPQLKRTISVSKLL